MKVTDPRSPPGATLASQATEDGLVGERGARGGEEDLRGRRLLHFTLGALLGRGGSGVVHEAWDEKLHRQVAVKIFPGASVRRREVLVREARSAAAIVHPNVAAVHDVHVVDETPFLVMELARGERLRDAIVRGPLSPARALAIAAEAASGLAAAHRQSIVHLDFKPENIVVGDGGVKILDFGLACRFGRAPGAASDGGDEARRARGTPSYMAPEQARGESVDARTDVYALGLVLFEMLSGRLPPRRGTVALAAAARDVSAAELATLAPSVKGALGSIMERCLRASPDDRFLDAGEVAARLSALERPAERARPRQRILLALGAITASLGVAFALAPARTKTSSRLAAPSLTASPVHGAAKLRRVTANPRENRLRTSALAKAGDAVAYVDATGLNVRALDGSEPRLVDTGGTPRLVTWFPDGKRLLASRRREDGTEELVELSASGGAARLVTAGTFTTIAISHDGGRLLASLGERVVILPLSGSAGATAMREIAAAPDCPIDAVAWAPDDTAVAWLDECPTPRLRVRGLDLEGQDRERGRFQGPTGDAQTVVEDPHLTQETGDGSVAWLSDGRLVFPRAEWLPSEPGSNLWAVTLDRQTLAPFGPPTRLTDWVGMVAIALSASDGGRLAFQRYEAQTDVFLGAWDAAAKQLLSTRRLTQSDRNDRSSAFTPDGRVLFMSDRNGRYEVFARRLDAPTDEPLWPRGDDWQTWPTPGPSGSVLFWSVPRTTDEAPTHPVLVRADPGRAPIALFTAHETMLAGIVGRPGPYARARCALRALERCFVSEIDGDALAFRTLDPATGATRPLLRAERVKDHDWDVSPDGSMIALPLERKAIALFDTRTGAPLPEVALPFIPASLAWSSGAGEPGWFVTAFTASRVGHLLAFVTLAGATTTLIEDRSDWFAHPAAAPDGQSIVYTVKHLDNDLWIIDGL